MVISRGIIRVAPVRALITLLITYLLSPLPLQVARTDGDLAPLHQVQPGCPQGPWQRTDHDRNEVVLYG